MMPPLEIPCEETCIAGFGSAQTGHIYSVKYEPHRITITAGNMRPSEAKNRALRVAPRTIETVEESSAFEFGMRVIEWANTKPLEWSPASDEWVQKSIAAIEHHLFRGTTTMACALTLTDGRVVVGVWTPPLGAALDPTTAMRRSRKDAEAKAAALLASPVPNHQLAEGAINGNH